LSGAPLGVALTAHWLELGAVLRLARRADELGYDLVIVDGDPTLDGAKPDRPVYDPTALAAAAIAHTRSARIAGIHLPLFWDAERLARQLATLQALANGRLVALFGVGATRAGAAQPGPAERVARLDELLARARALLSEPVPFAVSAAGPRALDVVRRHADVWDANVPPLAERLRPLRERLGRALPTWCWVFARPAAGLDEAAAAYHHHAPWFRGLAREQIARAILHGPPERCREQLERMREELDLALPVVDLTGLDEANARTALEWLAPAGARRIP
jgi:alkanesulfonate monooxygenase SsuD/methylene tetrahydromethanopterin reductase-like flavin-dependent oxidoreductase (luciferase family)